jgi:hypothetical protein
MNRKSKIATIVILFLVMLNADGFTQNNKNTCDSLIAVIQDRKWTFSPYDLEQKGVAFNVDLKKCREKFLSFVHQSTDTSSKIILYLTADYIKPLTVIEMNELLHLMPRGKYGYGKLHEYFGRGCTDDAILFLIKLLKRGSGNVDTDDQLLSILISYTPYSDGAASEAYSDYMDVLEEKGAYFLKLLQKHNDGDIELVAMGLWEWDVKQLEEALKKVVKKDKSIESEASRLLDKFKKIKKE